MTAPAQETLVSTLARKFRLEVNTGTRAAPVWTLVRGLTKFLPKIDSTLEDDTDFDSDGWASQTKTLLAWSLETTVKRGTGVDSGVYDPGQEALRTAAESFGPAGVVQVRWYDREGGPEAYSGDAEVSYAPAGDGPSALATADINLTGKGARLVITNPAPATGVPILASASPASAGTAGGDLVIVSGANFTGTTAVTVGGTAAEDFSVVSSTRLAVVTPALAAGEQDIVVTNAAGTSDPLAFTYA